MSINTKYRTWHKIFFSFLLVFLPTQLGYHFWPHWAMVLGRRVDYLSPTVYLTDILIFLMLAFWFVESKKKFQISHFKFFFPIFLFAFINIFLAKNQPVAIYKWLKVLEFVGLGWYIVRTKPRVATIVTPLSIGVLYSSVLAILQFLLQRSVGGSLWWLGERTFDVMTPGIARADWFGRELLRPYATFPHSNVLGGYLAAILPLVIIQLSNNPINKLSNAKKIFYFSIFVFGTIALVLTFSRSAIIVGAIALASVLFRKKMLMALGFVIFVFSLLPFSEESFLVRQELTIAAIKLWQNSPLFGVGLGNFLVGLPEALPTRTIYFLQPVHNIYLLLASEIGIIGVSILLWFFLRSFQNFKLSLLVLLLLGLVDHYPLTIQQGQLLLTLVIAMSYNRAHERDTMERPLQYRRASRRQTHR